MGQNVSTEFKASIKKYLDSIAGVDDSFADAYENNPGKSIEQCCEYILSCAKAGGCAGYDDKDVYGWAVHYYIEKDVKFEKVSCQKVVINHHVELTEQEKEELRQKAKDDFIRECKEKMKGNTINRKPAPAPVVKKDEPEVQEEEMLSLF